LLRKRNLPSKFFIDGSCKAVFGFAPRMLSHSGKLLFSRLLSRAWLKREMKIHYQDSVSF
jgi:hypothetical protein